MKYKIVITSGDPSGIGPELILKTFEKISKYCEPIVVGSKKLFSKASQVMNLPIPNNFKIYDINENFEYKPGQLSFINGRFAAKSIEKAVELCMNKNVDAIVTAPINKEAIQGAGYDFPGHTEFLMHLSSSNKTRMLFYHEKFSVLLHTIHIPLHDVFDSINEIDLIKDISEGAKDFKKTTKIEPEIVVCGINPHAGEHGKIGKEDFQITNAVKKLQNLGLKIKGPFPADTLFSKVMGFANHTLVYAMYHDQGLIPIKTLFPNSSINVTLGLPFIRTSVNHGTAFDIAWKGIADETNMIEAVKTAINFLKED